MTQTQAYALTTISPLDLFDLLPADVEIKEYNLSASVVLVANAEKSLSLFFITEPEAHDRNLEIVDSRISTLFETKPLAIVKKKKKTKAVKRKLDARKSKRPD